MPATTQTKWTNRRGSQRRAARGTVKIHCRRGAYGFGVDLAVRPLDLSESGARLVISTALDVMEEVEILITGYGVRGTIKRIGNIRWIVESADGTYCVGVEFQKRLPYRDWQNLVAPA